MAIKYPLILSIVFAFIGQLAAEQESVLSLDQAIELALNRNPELQSAALETKAQKGRLKQSEAFPNPDFVYLAEDIGGSDSYNEFESAQITYQINQVVELGGERGARIGIASAKLDLSRSRLELKRRQLVAEVTRSFVIALSAQQKLVVMNEIVELAQEFARTVSERIQAGKIPPIEHVKADALVASTKIEVQRTKRDLDAARNRLAATWGSQIPEFDKLEGSLDVVLLPDVKTLKEKLSKSPEIMGAGAEIFEGKAALKMEKAKVIPNVLIAAGYRQFNFTGDHAFVFGASVPLPLFDRNRGGIAEAENRLAAVDHRKIQTELRLNLELETAYQKAATAEVENSCSSITSTACGSGGA